MESPPTDPHVPHEPAAHGICWNQTTGPSCKCPDPELVISPGTVTLYRLKLYTEMASQLDIRCHCCMGMLETAFRLKTY